ncbi:hypothetical protein IF1G_04900 [Cordyceps javanica]|uniref:Uncharacterized protein n=1 Tax=Cordyceps javanica TaxID=43265 RepID=A0A545V3M9_9HYPO|nr:hypothetical protein IF1G_04900 [Cordyceps javanica]
MSRSQVSLPDSKSGNLARHSAVESGPAKTSKSLSCTPGHRRYYTSLATWKAGQSANGPSRERILRLICPACLLLCTFLIALVPVFFFFFLR